MVWVFDHPFCTVQCRILGHFYRCLVEIVPDWLSWTKRPEICVIHESILTLRTTFRGWFRFVLFMLGDSYCPPLWVVSMANLLNNLNRLMWLPWSAARPENAGERLSCPCASRLVFSFFWLQLTTAIRFQFWDILRYYSKSSPNFTKPVLTCCFDQGCACASLLLTGMRRCPALYSFSYHCCLQAFLPSKGAQAGGGSEQNLRQAIVWCKLWTLLQWYSDHAS